MWVVELWVEGKGYWGGGAGVVGVTAVRGAGMRWEACAWVVAVEERMRWVECGRRWVGWGRGGGQEAVCGCGGREEVECGEERHFRKPQRVG